MTTLALFGRPAENFSQTRAREIYVNTGWDGLKTYLRGYFAKMEVPVANWAFHRHRGEVLFLPKDKLSFYVGGAYYKNAEDKKGKDVCAHMSAEFELCDSSTDCRYGRTYESGGKTIINTFGGWLHPDTDEVPNAAEMKMIEPWLKHLRTVWCRNNKEHYAWVLRWFARIAQKKQNYTGMFSYAKTHGTGRSLVYDLLRDFVFGKYAVLITNSLKAIYGNGDTGENGQLEGKAIVVISDPHAKSRSEYLGLEEIFKEAITGKTRQSKHLFRGIVTVDNTLHWVMNFNTPHAFPVSGADRRWFDMMVDESFARDKDYYVPLYTREHTQERNMKLGLAMWKYLCNSVEVDSFIAADSVPPVTANKILRQMPEAAKYVKARYLDADRKCGFEIIGVKEFYEEYKRYWTAGTPMAKGKFFESLFAIPGFARKDQHKFINPITKKPKSVAAVLGMSYEVILKIFMDNNWITADDHVDQDDMKAVPVKVAKAVPAKKPAPVKAKVVPPKVAAIKPVAVGIPAEYGLDELYA